ncbi:MAG: S8 family serine peptidase [Clostridiales bacterium]|nr:S8 family serine peptidase [Clostridiales bacterium]
MKKIRGNIFRKALAFLLAFALVFGLAGTAFAEGYADIGLPSDDISEEAILGLPPDDGMDGTDLDLPADDASEDALDDLADNADEDDIGLPPDGMDSEDSSHGFPGMPEGYALTENESRLKQELISEDILEVFDNAVPDEDYIEGEAVFLADSHEHATAIAEAYGGELDYFQNNVAIVSLPEEATTLDAVAAAADRGNNLPPVFPNIRYSKPTPVEEEAKVSASGGLSAFAADHPPQKRVWSPGYEDAYLQNPDDAPYNYQWFHDTIGTHAAWGTTMGDGVTVAVLDTGVQSDHPDLSPVMEGMNTTGGVLIDTSDADGHGTHVAGIVAARENIVGGRGVAPNAALLPVKVLDDDGFGNTAWIASGITWAANINDNGIPLPGDRRADVINMSLGDITTSLTSDLNVDVLLRRVVAAAIDIGIVVVAAVGNDGTTNRPVPAAFPNVIPVASTDMNNLRSNFSNWGTPGTIAAPGSYIVSAFPTAAPIEWPVISSGYAALSGTSMAAPMVAGAAALYISMLPEKPRNLRDVTAVRNALNKNAVAAGSPNIGRVLNVSKMFDTIERVPVFTVRDGDENTIADIARPVPNNSTVEITGAPFIVYTVNGSNPAVRNGAVTNGEVLTGRINLGDYPVGRVVIRALCVNNQGIAGRVASRTLTTVAAAGTGGAVKNEGGMSPISGPANLRAGGSGKYVASVTALAPPGTNRTVVWSVDQADSAKATINSSGTLRILTTDAAVGTVKIYARARVTSTVASDTVFSEYTVTIVPAITSIALPPAADIETLYVGGPATPGVHPGSHAIVPTVTFADETFPAPADWTGFIRWTSSHPSRVSVDATGVVTARGSGTATITAAATDGSGRTARTKVRSVLPATEVNITNATLQIARGQRHTLKAATVPSRPTTRGVIWEVDGDAQSLGVSINSSGRLSVPTSVPVGTTILVEAYAKDGLGAVGDTEIMVVDRRASSVAILSFDDSGRATERYNRTIDGDITTAVRLFTLNPPSVTDYDRNLGGGGATPATVDETKIKLGGYAINDNAVTWRSSNTRVADIVITPGISTIEVVAVGPGRATLTCTASDGGGKRATVTVNVAIPASSLFVQGRNPLTTYNNPSLAFGKSLRMSAVLGNAYGKPSSSKVKWTRYAYLFDGTKYYTYSPLGTKTRIASNGTLSTRSNLRNDWDYLRGQPEFASYLAILVFAEAVALDGSGVVGEMLVDIVPPATAMRFSYRNVSTAAGGAGYSYCLPFVGETWYDEYIITSSKPNVVAITGYNRYHYTPGWGFFHNCVGVYALGRGKSNIKIVAGDGSGRSATCTFTVR